MRCADNEWFFLHYFEIFTNKKITLNLETPKGQLEELKSEKDSQIAVKREFSDDNDDNDMDNMDFSSENNSNSYSQGKNLVQNVKDNLNTLSSSSYNKKKITLKRWWTPEEVGLFISIYNFY